MKIGYQGIAGSYSEAASIQYQERKQAEIKNWDMLGYNSFVELVQDVASQKLDAAMMPVENSTTGLIDRTMDLYRGQSVLATAEVYQPVQHILWGVPGGRIEDLEEVYSHPEALSQCRNFFAAHPWIQPIAYTDTAQSAKLVADEQNPKLAALASPRCGDLYQLIPLQKEIQSEETNTTRFFLMESFVEPGEGIGKYLQEMRGEHPKRTRLMLYVETPHKPGALAKLLNTFNLYDCNLEGLDARPIADQPFAYGFFIEVDISHVGIDMEIFWKTLAYASNRMQLIGCFEPMNDGKIGGEAYATA